MNLYPFIEAEKAGSGNVTRACELLQVSRAAYYAQRTGFGCKRRREDAELTEAIKDVHEQSKGRYGAPRIHAELRRCDRRHGKKRIARLMRRAGVCGRTPMWKKTTIPTQPPRPEPTSSAVTSPPTPASSTVAGAATSATCRPGRAGSTSPPSSTSHPAAQSGSRWPATSEPSSSPTRSPTRSRPATPPPA